MANLIKGDIVKESVSYFKEYAYDTIQDRAIPSVVDGMKPSGRKILYTMYDLNLHHKAQRRKVNTVAGSVLRFSVHGDASVSGAITNMGAWFKTNIPYVDGLGNFGNIDATEPASSRYCCTGDTVVLEKTRGLMTHLDIADLSMHATDKDGYIDLSQHNIEVKGPRGQWVPVKKMVDSGVHDVYKVTLANGMVLKCTANHPLLRPTVNKEKFPTVVWTRVESLKVGDSVLIDNCHGVEDERELTPDEIMEAKFLGAMISEGSVSTDYRINITNSDMDLIQPVLDFYGVGEDLIKHKVPKEPNRIPYMSLTVCGKDKYDKLLGHYQFGRYSNERRIPGWVFSKPRAYKALLLKYLFEGDGSADFKVDNRRGRPGVTCRVSYDTNSPALRDGVIWLLNEFGIESGYKTDLRERRQGYSYKITISSRFMCDRFRKLIGFVSERKNSVLDRFVITNGFKVTTGGKRGTVDEWIDLIPDRVGSIANQMGFYCNFKSGLKTIQRHDEFLSNFYKYYAPMKIKSIEKMELKDRVYSLVIDNDEHAYITNGIISHNTEARLSEYSDTIMLNDMGKATVEWTKSYDDTLDEPILLPVMLPNLLINGCPSGIAVGYACNHVPHNPLDVIDLVEAYVNDRKISVDKMISIIKGPDFPTGGVINGLEGVHRAYKTGKGSVLVRGRYKTFDDNGYTTIRIYEVPFTSNTNTIYNQIAQLANAGKIKIKPRGLHDHTDMEGTKLDITLKKDEDIDRVINTLYKETDFELRVPMMNYVVTRNRKLHLATLDYMISEFVSYREEVIWKRLKNELDEKNKRIHLLDGLVIINKDMDKAIKMIRGSKGKADAKDKLMKSFKLDDIQAEYILNMAVYRLSSIEIQSVINEQKDLMKRCKDLMAWTKTKSNKNIDKIMLDEWEGLRNGLFKGYKRKTKINAKYEHISTMETIREDPMTVIITKEGYVKKFAGHTVGFETSPATLGITNDDEIYHLVRTFENKTLVIMTDRGKVFNIAVHTIDITNKRGKLLRNMVLAKDYENVLEIWQGYDDDRTVLTISESGMMKATKPELLRGISSQGKLVHQIGRNEKLAGICHVDPKGNIVIMTAKGQILRTNGNITCTGLGGVGVVGIKLRDEDKVVGIVSTDKVIMMCTNDGYYKAIAVSDITLQNRGGLGLIGHNCKGDQRVVDIKNDSVHRWVTNIGINQSYREILLGKTASRTSKGTKLPYGNITKLTEWR